MDKSHDTTVLNTLIATTLDSMKGYRESAGESENATHRQFFNEMAEERSQVASDLQAQVRSLGGDPEMDSSTAGAAHRGWVNLKSAITGRDEQAIVNEVERGEDYIKEKFETAMMDDELSPETRGKLETCFGSIRKGHERASQMKHSMEHAG
jgi:uncharacterized protein (TIGR02284 family)